MPFAYAPHLLIADDDRDFREMLGSALQSRGFRTSLATDGLEALALVRSQDVHLLLVDLQMPGLSGLETIQRLQSEQIQLPWILVSGSLDESVVEEARAYRVRAVLSKPINLKSTSVTVLQIIRETYPWLIDP